jgi:hypothetical protein
MVPAAPTFDAAAGFPRHSLAPPPQGVLEQRRMHGCLDVRYVIADCMRFGRTVAPPPRAFR